MVPSVRIVKQLHFKGGIRLFSNRYHFTGGVPADDTHWHTLFDNIVTAEKAIFDATVIVEALGYLAGSDVAVSTKNYSTAGTLTAVGGNCFATGEVAALVRWSTAAKSTKNHPIYGFSYYHGALVGPSATTCDSLDANQKAAMLTYATQWVTGFSDGSITCKRATPAGHVATGQIVEEYVTHRDFPHTPSL